MIQELLGGRATGLISHTSGGRKISINSNTHDHHQAAGTPPLILQTFPISSSPSLPPSSSCPPNTSTTTSAENQNLRCPRCDSTNTKFCYYNNYNLTQPRHFCKTCRRYWTKGGALRNVPIGGGCRKNKGGSNSSTCGINSSLTSSAASMSPSTAAKAAKTVLSMSDFDKRGEGGDNLGNGGFVQDHHFHQQHSNAAAITLNSPPGGPQTSTSHILALLRAAQNPNCPNPLSNAPFYKTEGLTRTAAGLLNGSNNSGLDSYTRAPPPLGLGSGDNFWKNNQVVQNSSGSLRELFQKLKSSSPSRRNFYGDQHNHHPGAAAAMFLSNNITSAAAFNCSSNCSTAELESGAATVSEAGANHHDFGYSFAAPNLTSCWSDLSAPKGA